MKKVIYILAGIAVTATLMAGCASSNTKDTQNKQDTQSTSTTDGTNNQKNVQVPDLEGEVSNISGNKITLKVIKMPDKTQGGASGDTNTNSDAAKTDAKANDKDAQAHSGQPNMQVEYTGETKDITIGDGIKVQTMNMDQGNRQLKDITASDIKVGDVLRITYSDKDKETISTINVMPAANDGKK